MIRRPPRSTLFPYTTLFRSFNPHTPAALDLPRPVFMTMGRVAVEKNLEAFLSLDLRSEEHTSELQSRLHLVCRLLLEKKKKNNWYKHLSQEGDDVCDEFGCR